VVAQAGAFAEHTIRSVQHTACPDDSWIGDLYDYGHGEPAVVSASTPVDGPWLRVDLPPSTRVRLTLALDLHTRPGSYRTPFEDPS
jgi:hypothetical protein